jgi:hypothetical protein
VINTTLVNIGLMIIMVGVTYVVALQVGFLITALVDEIQFRRSIRAWRKAHQQTAQKVIRPLPFSRPDSATERCNAHWLDKYGSYAEGIDFEGRDPEDIEQEIWGRIEDDEH